MKKIIIILLFFCSYGLNAQNLFTFSKSCGWFSGASCTTCSGGYSSAYFDGLTIKNKGVVYAQLQAGWSAKQKGEAITFTTSGGVNYTINRSSTTYPTMAAFRAAIEGFCSGTGGGVTYTAGAGISIVGTVISATEIDGNITNEGLLSVTAGSSTSSVITSNTSGSASITLQAGIGTSITEVGTTITIAASSAGLNTYIGGTSAQANIAATTGGVLVGAEYLWDDGFALHRLTRK